MLAVPPMFPVLMLSYANTPLAPVMLLLYRRVSCVSLLLLSARKMKKHLLQAKPFLCISKASFSLKGDVNLRLDKESIKGVNPSQCIKTLV